MILQTIFSYLHTFLSSNYFILGIALVSAIFNIFVLINVLAKRKSLSKSSFPSFLFLIGILASAILVSVDLIIDMFNTIFFKESDHLFFIFSNRVAWASLTPQYQFLSLFVESLVTKNFKLTLRHKMFSLLSALFSCFFMGMAFIDIGRISVKEKPWIEIFIQKLTCFYDCYVIMITSLLYALWHLKKSKLPRLLYKQLTLFLSLVIFPFWISDLVQITPFVLSINLNPFFNAGIAWTSLSTALITIAIIYCSKRILGLRFLNLTHQVQSPIDINFMEHFKTILEQFTHVTDMQELVHITQGFFKESFSIPHNRVHLFIRPLGREGRVLAEENTKTAAIIEEFMHMHSATLAAFIKKSGVLVYDELVFSDFYESSPESTASVGFLNSIQADIFIPIYEKDNMIAYIVVDRFARLDAFYTNTEYDEILIYIRYLSNIINLMQNKNLDVIIRQEKQLKEELYTKHQEIDQYKESIRSFLRNQKHKQIGIVFYKNRRFSFANQTAKQLIGVNPNMQEGHPTAKALKQVAQKVETYKTAQTVHTKDIEGNKIVLSGMPGLEHNNVIISLYYPEVTDVIKRQIDMLKDPSEWDYLLYLETTHPGTLINQLIPGDGEMLLNFKIELLKAALSKKAILLNLPEKDVAPMVELLHRVSLRQSIQVIDLKTPEKGMSTAVTLFGINSLFNMVTSVDALPLLEKMDNIGTIFIKNIEHLDLETQEYLAEYIRYGFFRIFKSEHKIPSNVRLICSTTKNLDTLVREDKFSQALFNELKDATLEMPSLLTLPEKELAKLAEGFSEQAILNLTYKNLLNLSEKDKQRLALHRPASLVEFKAKVQQMLTKKSKKSDIYEEAQFNHTYEVSEPELVQAARMGKKALKDQKVMTLLWNKFKNQNKIAAFLGVNRSSVNRRCKQYHLIE